MSQEICGHPIVTYPPARRVSFTFDGVPMTGRAGAPIASALLENGVQAFRRTHRQGAPRSLFCGIGQCTDCVVVVNGQPNVRSCVTPLAEGMAIETQRGHGKVVIP